MERWQQDQLWKKAGITAAKIIVTRSTYRVSVKARNISRPLPLGYFFLSLRSPIGYFICLYMLAWGPTILFFGQRCSVFMH
jgi:hypothetical protein